MSIAGVTGQYPSASYPLPSASAIADLDTATFNAKIKSSADFEYWTSAGVYQSGSGDADIQDFNIKNGVSIFNTLGLYSAPPVSPSGQIRHIFNAVYRNRPEMAGLAAGLPLPQWIEEDDFWFETGNLDHTGTSTSRRGVAPIPIPRELTGTHHAGGIRRRNVVR